MLGGREERGGRGEDRCWEGGRREEEEGEDRCWEGGRREEGEGEDWGGRRERVRTGEGGGRGKDRGWGERSYCVSIACFLHACTLVKFSRRTLCSNLTS